MQDVKSNNFEPLAKAFDWNYILTNDSEDLRKCITVKNKGDMYMYCYNDNVFVPRNNPVIMVCRGIVVDKDGNIMNFPFIRFFNEWENESCSIDWDTAEVQEKADGSLVNVFWNYLDNKWEVTTKNSFYPNPDSDTDFQELFTNRFNNFNKLKKDKCYMFELVTRYNPIVKLYDEERVYLIGARGLNTLQELSQKRLDKIAEELQVMRPTRYSADSVEKCKELFENFEEDDEGLVVVDQYFCRIKIKQESYLRLAKIKMLKEQDILDYVLGKIEIDNEFLEKLPDVKERVEEIKEYWEKIKAETYRVFEQIKDKPTRKEFAMEAKKYKVMGFLFAVLDGKDLDSMDIRWKNIKNMLD